MKEEIYIPSVVDFAYEVINMHKEILYLRSKVEHHEEMEKIHMESISNSDKHHKEFLGIILGATLDPGSAINRGHAALIREEVSENEQ